MSQPLSMMIPIEDVSPDLLPEGKYDPNNPTHADIIVDNFRRDGGASGFFSDVHFDGLVVQISQNLEAEKELESCIELLQLGGYQPAISRLERLLESYPYHSALLYNTGMAHRELGDLDRSIQLLEQLTQIAPNHVRGFVALSVSMFSARRQAEALQAIQQAFEKDSKDPFVLRTYGSLQAAAGAGDKAIELLNQALELMPNDAQSHLTIAQILHKSDPEKAKDHLNTVIRTSPGSSLATAATKLKAEL